MVSVAVAATSIVVACKYSSPATSDDIPGDGITIDAGPCLAAGMECVDNGTSLSTMLRTCDGSSGSGTITTCAWGCSSVGSVHCGKLQPSGGGVIETDLDPDETLGDVTLSGNVDIHSDGEITGTRVSGSNVISGVKFIKRNNIAVYVFKRLTVGGTLVVKDNSPIALVALEGMTLANIDANGGCGGSGADGGGFDGGAKTQPGNGATSGGAAGAGAANNSSGGAGGAFGGGGGSGGSGVATVVTAGGLPTGEPTILVLRGGGGGGGGGNNGGVGGGGGGAVQLVSNATITITGGINAGGCGGTAGANDSGGGGGGAGGAILIEGPQVQLQTLSFLAVNGGAGGGADQSSMDGEDGRGDLTQALGGIPGVGGGSGGLGAAGNVLAGGNGVAGTLNGGGGGGGVGWIRIETLFGMATIDSLAVISPPLTAPSSTASQGPAIVH